MKTAITKEKFIELRAEGLSYGAIAKRISTAKSTLVGWGQELEVIITDRKDDRIEDVKTKYKLHREAQMTRYGKWLKEIEKELSRRDFTDVKTDRLLHMAVQLTSELRSYGTKEDTRDKGKNVITIADLEAIARGDFVITN